MAYSLWLTAICHLLLAICSLLLVYFLRYRATAGFTPTFFPFSQR